MTRKRYSIPDFKETGHIKTVDEVVGEIPVAKWLVWGFNIKGQGYLDCDGEFTDKARPVSYQKVKKIQAKHQEKYSGTHYFICRVEPVIAGKISG